MKNKTLNYYGEHLSLLPNEIIKGAIDHIVEIAKNRFGAQKLSQLNILDVGSGRGEFTEAMAPFFKSITGVEPYVHAYMFAKKHARSKKITYHHTAIEDFVSKQKFDMIVTLTVFEHMPDHKKSFDKMFALLKPGGIIYLTAPNKYWIFEQHYGLPFLAWLPLPIANKYLQITKGKDSFEDSSYSKGYPGMCTFFNSYPCSYKFVLPDDPNNKYIGYGRGGIYAIVKNIGISLIAKFPIFWHISKGFIMVIEKNK